MSKYNNIFEGKILTDVSADEGGYNYYGFLSVDNSWVILRETTTQDEYRVFVGRSGYAAAFAAHVGHNYKRMNEFGFKTI